MTANVKRARASLGAALLLVAMLAPGIALAQVDPAVLAGHKAPQSASDPALAALASASDAERRAIASLLGASVRGSMVTVDLAGSDPTAMASAMSAMGVRDMATFGGAMSARVPIDDLASLAQVPALRVARPALAQARAGVVDSQGDAALRSDVARARGGTLQSGRGIRVGVLSDTFRCNPDPAVPGAPTSTADEDVRNGDLPADYIVLDNGSCPGTDEGRGMAQLIYDVAPRSVGAFHTAFGGQADFANGILELISEAGADVVVDDVIYFAEAMFQDGPIAQAATQATRMGVPYFSSAGNNARGSYESSFRPVDIGGGLLAHDFDPTQGIDVLQDFDVLGDATGFAQITPSFQWDEPFFSISGASGSASDLDMVFFDAGGNLLLDCLADMDPIAFPDTGGFPPVCQFGSTINTGGDAVELPSVVSFVGDVTVQVALIHFEGPPPTRVKYVPFSQGGTFAIPEYDTRSGTVYGHANAAGVMGIGAAPFNTTAAFGDPDFGGACLPACAEPFSSAGGVEVRLDTAGNRLATPENRLKPDVTGPDGSNTSFFIADSIIDDDDGDGLLAPGFDGESPADEFPNFFGTSASAPHVAAVAALMLDASVPLAVAASDGTRQRLCLSGSRTVLVPDDVGNLLVQLLGATGVVRRGFCLGPRAVELALEATALDMSRRAVDRLEGTFEDIVNPIGFDFDTGAGFVDANAAIGLAARLGLLSRL